MVYIKPIACYYALVVVTAFMAWGFWSMEQLLINRIELKEIVVTIAKKHYPLPPYPMEHNVVETEYMRRMYREDI